MPLQFSLQVLRKLYLYCSLKWALLTLSVALTWFLLLWNLLYPAATKVPSHFAQENLDYFCLCDHCPQCGSLSLYVPGLPSSAAPSPASRFPMDTRNNSLFLNKLGQTCLFFAFGGCDCHLKTQILAPLFSHLWVGDKSLEVRENRQNWWWTYSYGWSLKQYLWAIVNMIFFSDLCIYVFQ